jgi:Lrp/AsnC family leucine-responsive transcriptional regulator
MSSKQRENGHSTDGSPLDTTNRSLLAELQVDARLSLAELGSITGYRTEIDPRALGYSLSAVVRVRPASRQLQRVAEIARSSAEVVECHRITGEDCFFMKAHVRSITHLEELIDRFIPYGQTTTSIIQSSPVPPRGPALNAN